jgi:adenine-specific DNA-methyltransferase
MGDFLKKQIITYMGNKRKLLTDIEEVINDIKLELGHDLICGDGFSGSGIVSRLLKIHSSKLYSNDTAGYSKTMAECFLYTPTSNEFNKIKAEIIKANKYVDNENTKGYNWIQNYWTPLIEEVYHGKIQISGNRAYFTKENGKRIDKYRYYIDNYTKDEFKPFLLAQLIIKSSIHNNTNGQFSAYFKGSYGGLTNVDIKRISKKIILDYPIFNSTPCDVIISRLDTNEWIRNIDEQLDIVYYDPPYNKHPYHIFYFLLDIINNWNMNQEIPDTYRGQPKNWIKSDYNSQNKALNTLDNLIKNTKSKYIILSYNNKGIIPIDQLENMLNKYGKLKKKNLIHKTYKHYEGIASYKRSGGGEEKKATKEYLFILKLFK